MASCVDSVEQEDCIQEANQQIDGTQEAEKGNGSVSDINNNIVEDETTKIEESNLFRIPTEIRADILERLDAKSVLQLRCTHPLLKNLVDHYFGVNLSITEELQRDLNKDEREKRFEFYGGVAVRNLSVGHLRTPTWEAGIGTHNTKRTIKTFSKSFDNLFLHPEYLKNINLDGPLHVYYIRKFFLSCQNLVNLSVSTNAYIVGGCIFSRLDHKDLTYEAATNHLYKIHLPKLKFLKLFVMDPSKSYLNLNQMDNSLSILRTVWSNCLKRIIVQVWITPQYSFTSVSWILTTFLKLHPTLSSVFISFLYDHSVSSDTALTEMNKSEEVKLHKEICNISKSLKLEKLGICSKSSHLKVWESLVGEQRNLNHLSLTYTGSRFSNWEYLTQSSAATISQLFVRGEFWVPYDCFSLENCTNLDEICLHNTNDNIIVQNSTVKNVSYIPSRLRSLILFNTIVSTEDTLTLLKKLDKLETLVLFKTGRGNGNGVDVNCVEQTFQIRTLMSVLIVRFVADDRKDAKRIMQMMDMQDHPRPTRTPTAEEDSDWESEDTDESDTDHSSSDELASESGHSCIRATVVRHSSETTLQSSSEIAELTEDSDEHSGINENYHHIPSISLGENSINLIEMKGIEKKCTRSRSTITIPSEESVMANSAQKSIKKFQSQIIKNLCFDHSRESAIISETDDEENILPEDPLKFYRHKNDINVGPSSNINWNKRLKFRKSSHETASKEDMLLENISNDSCQAESTSIDNEQAENTSIDSEKTENTFFDSEQAANTSIDNGESENTQDNNLWEENSISLNSTEENIISLDSTQEENTMDDVAEISTSENSDDDEDFSIGMGGLINGMHHHHLGNGMHMHVHQYGGMGHYHGMHHHHHHHHGGMGHYYGMHQHQHEGPGVHLHGGMGHYGVHHHGGIGHYGVHHHVGIAHYGMQAEIQDDMEEEAIFEFDDVDNNIAAINVNLEGNDVQMVFEGEIDIEDIDLQDILPDVQVQFVLDTILDVLDPNINVQQSHWNRAEDVYGNVVFTLKLSMKTDY